MRKFLPALLTLALSASYAAADNAIAVAIVYDTSGSMRDPVKGTPGKREPKFVIANRALEAIVARLERFSGPGKPPLHVGLWTFSKSGGQASVPLGPFNAAAFRKWIAEFKNPTGGTPLGNAVQEASRALLEQKAASRHVLVITDGMNTIGPKPEQVLRAEIDSALKKGAPLFFHFVAFDVDARVFTAVKDQGATLLGAADEAQLNSQLAVILEEEILLEKQ